MLIRSRGHTPNQTHCNGGAILARPTGEADVVGRDQVDSAEEKCPSCKQELEWVMDAKKGQRLQGKITNSHTNKLSIKTFQQVTQHGVSTLRFEFHTAVI